MAAALAVLLLVNACSSATPSIQPQASPATSSAPSAAATPGTTQFVSAAPPATPAPSLPPNVGSLQGAAAPAGFVSHITCAGSIGASDPVAIVIVGTNAAGDAVRVLRDYADVAHPRTVCHFADEVLQLLDARHVIVDGCGANDDCIRAVVDLPEVRYHWYVDPASAAGLVGEWMAVSPDLSSTAWVQWPDGSSRSLVVTDAAGTHQILGLRDEGGRCGGDDDSIAMAFTRSGTLFYLLDQPQPPDNTLAVVRGLAVQFSLPPPASGWNSAAEPAMAVWSPTAERLFYRRASTVWQWTPQTGAKVLLNGVRWQYPTISPDGRHLAYSVETAGGSHDVYLMDLVSGGAPVRIGKDRNNPAFLNNGQLWFQSVVAGGCAGGPVVPKHLIYNIVSRTESASIIQGVENTWPATSSNLR